MRKLGFVTLTLFAACSKPNPYYCEGNPDNNCLLDADVNAPQGCANNAQCTNGSKPVCDLADKVCVACTADNIGSCSGTTPVCSANETCAPCTSNAQCSADACLPTGACGDDSNVAYVAATGDDASPCTRSAPCKKIATAATKGKPYIKVETDLDEAVLLDNVNVTILAESGVAVKRTSTGPVFEIRGTSTVAIRDLTIREGLGTNGHGILVSDGEQVALTLDHVNIVNNSATGLVVGGASLTMSRCVVSGNSAGGGKLSTTFNITNSLFVRNGSATSNTGGLYLTPSGSTTFKFNTVANNTSSNALRGINCTLPVLGANNIVSGNEISSSCNFEYSLFDTTVAVSGTNRAGDAKFRNVDPSNPLANDYFRIETTSDAVDHADPTSTMSNDIDGDARPSGNGSDIGADELGVQ